MGDARFERHLARVLDRGSDAMGELADDELIQALAALASRLGEREAYLANVLASEAMNRLARAHATVMNSDEGLLAVDMDGSGVFANPAAQVMLGWTERELRGVHVHTLVHDRDAEEGCKLGASLDSLEPRGRDRSVFLRKDGTTIAVEFSVAPVERDGARHGSVIAFHAAPGPDADEPASSS